MRKDLRLVDLFNRASGKIGAVILLFVCVAVLVSVTAPAGAQSAPSLKKAITAHLADQAPGAVGTKGEIEMAAGTVTYPDTLNRWGKDDRGLSARTAFKYTGPSTYTTGGDALTAQQVKLGTIEWCPPVVAIATTGAATAIVFQYNYATGKIQAFWADGGAAGGAALAEVDASTDLSDYVAHFVAEGRG